MTESGRRESRNVLLKKLDARLRGHDGENSPTLQLNVPEIIAEIELLYCDSLTHHYFKH
jgi:hypothetical protein